MKMNEQVKELIKELAVEAGGEHPRGVYPGAVLFYPKQLEIFAQLIVQECAQFVEDKFDFCGDEIIIAEEVRKHFGVEVDDEVEYCPKCNAERSGTSCGLNDCGWIVGVEE